NGEFDTYAAYRRHGVGAVADTEQAGARPFAKAINANTEEIDVLPVGEIGHPIAEMGRDVRDVGAKRGQATALNFLVGAFQDDPGTLPVVAAVDRNEHFPWFEIAESAERIIGTPRDSHPENIHRSA